MTLNLLSVFIQLQSSPVFLTRNSNAPQTPPLTSTFINLLAFREVGTKKVGVTFSVFDLNFYPLPIGPRKYMHLTATEKC